VYDEFRRAHAVRLTPIEMQVLIYMNYTEKNKDTETKKEIPTPTPAASVRQTPHNSTEVQTETEKQAFPTSHL